MKHTGRTSRRTLLKQVGAGAAGVALSRWGGLNARAQGAGSLRAQARVEVLLQEPVTGADGRPATINPMIHGQFAEHLGRVIYDGIWVGPESKIPHINGFRKALVESMRKIRLPVIRWPGGCFADRYHWRDGIGPRESRPRRFGRWNEVTEPNLVGTHEFVEFCRLVESEPYFCANVGTGTAEEFQQWLEYCNAPAGSLTVADERVANGAREPFRVRYWAIGNENWDCGGHMTPEDYGMEYRRFVTWPPSYGVPYVFVACGPAGNNHDWTRRFFRKWVDGPRAPMHGFAAHYYCGSSGTATDFTIDQWYDLLERAWQMERLVTDQWAIMGEFDPGHEVKLLVDEWGTWHPPDPRFPASCALCQINTLRDALVAALTLDIFHRHADKLMMSNIAQLVNCLQALYMAEEDKFVETVNHHVYAMYQMHREATALQMRVEAPPCSFRRGEQPAEVFRLAGSASLRDRTLNLSLVHTHASEPIEVAVYLRGGRPVQVRGQVLTHERLNAFNHFENPTDVVPRGIQAEAGESSLTMVLPPASVTAWQVTLG